MKRKIALILGILGITVSTFAFTGTTANIDNSVCPLKGTPACPDYPSCCKIVEMLKEFGLNTNSSYEF